MWFLVILVKEFDLVREWVVLLVKDVKMFWVLLRFDLRR